MMLGFSTASWMRFFALGFVVGVFLSFVPYQPMAFLGRIDAVAAFFGMILVSIYMRSYEQWAWRRMLVRIRRWRNSVAGAYALDDDRARRPLLSP
jgi:hypothetical protein